MAQNQPETSTPFIMKPIEVLKKGLARLHDQIRERKAKLDIDLKASRPILEVDQDWLDGDGNLVDEEKVVETLDSALLRLLFSFFTLLV